MFKSVKYNYLVKQYRNAVYTYSFYMTRNRMDADDITQETLIRLWENIGLFEDRSTKAWIMKTTHNLCLDLLRRRHRAMTKEFHQDHEDGEEEIEIPDAGTDSPETAVHLKLASEAIKKAVQNLSDPLRSVFVLYEIEGFKYREIAEILKLPEGTVKVDLMRARKRLQMELKCYEA